MILLLLSVTFDRVVAGVENQAITLSFVKEVSPFYPGASNNEIIKKLVEERVLYRIAREESIEVSDQEVEDAFKRSIQSNPSLKNYLDEKLRDLYRMEIRYQLYIQKLLQKKVIPEIHITRGEIEKYYSTHRDSLVIPPSVTIEKVSLEIGKTNIEKLKKKAEKIIEEAKRGKTFEELASKYSDDIQTKYSGGRLGDIPLMSLPPYFYGVDTLRQGDIGIFTSPMGVHILKVNSRTASSINLSHIFLKSTPSTKEIEEGMKKAKEIIKRWQSGDTTISVERIGPIPLTMMNESLKELIDTLKVGQISNPIVEGNTINVIKVAQKDEGGLPPLKDIEEKIQQILFSKKIEEGYKRLLKEASEKVFYIYL